MNETIGYIVLLTFLLFFPAVSLINKYRHRLDSNITASNTISDEKIELPSKRKQAEGEKQSKLSLMQERLKYEIATYGMVFTRIDIPKNELFNTLKYIFPYKSRNEIVNIMCKYFDHVLYREYRTLASDLMNKRKKFLVHNSLYSCYYLPSTLQRLDCNKYSVWLLDLSNLYISEYNHLDIANDYQVYIFIETIHDFNKNEIQYLKKIGINRIRQIIYYNDDYTTTPLSTFGTEAIDYKIFNMLLEICREKPKVAYTKDIISSMHWREFEEFIEKLFIANGYSTLLTPPSWDEGKDIVATKNGVKYFIECKHWSSDLVGREYLQKLVGAAAPYRVNHVIFITTSGYHDNAIAYANLLNKTDMKISLWGMADILELANYSNIATLNNKNFDVRPARWLPTN